MFRLLIFFGWLYTLLVVLASSSFVALLLSPAGKSLLKAGLIEKTYLLTMALFMLAAFIEAFGWIKQKQWFPKWYWSLTFIYLTYLPFEWWALKNSATLNQFLGVENELPWTLTSFILTISFGIWIWLFRARFDH